MTLDGEAHQVVGVVAFPAGYPQGADLMTRLFHAEEDLWEGMRGARYLDVVGRVAPGRTAAEASAEVDAFVTGLGEAHPQHAGWGGGAVILGRDLMRAVSRHPHAPDAGGPRLPGSCSGERPRASWRPGGWRR